MYYIAPTNIIIIIIKYHIYIALIFKQMLRSAQKLNEWSDHNIKLVITLLYTSIYRIAMFA